MKILSICILSLAAISCSDSEPQPTPSTGNATLEVSTFTLFATPLWAGDSDDEDGRCRIKLGDGELEIHECVTKSECRILADGRTREWDRYEDQSVCDDPVPTMPWRGYLGLAVVLAVVGWFGLKRR